MATPTHARNGEPSSPLDVVLKYGVLIAVVTYAVGVLCEFATTSRLGLALADFPLTDRRVLVSGGAILLWIVLCVGISAVLAAVLHREAASRWLPVAMVLLVPPLFWFALRWLRTQATSAERTDWQFLVYGVVLSWVASWLLLSSYRVLPPLSPLRHTALLVLTLVFLVLLSARSGYLTADTLLRSPKVHLLIAPDAVVGARQLGIPFLEQPDGTPAQLSQEVRIVYIGERTMLIQLANGRMVQFDRSKISGGTRH